MGVLRKGYWEKGMSEFMDVNGDVYKVNPENGIYKSKDVDAHGNVKYTSRMAGSCKPDSKIMTTIEDLHNGREKIIKTDVNGRIYSTEIRTKRG